MRRYSTLLSPSPPAHRSLAPRLSCMNINCRQKHDGLEEIRVPIDLSAAAPCTLPAEISQLAEKLCTVALIQGFSTWLPVG